MLQHALSLPVPQFPTADIAGRFRRWYQAHHNKNQQQWRLKKVCACVCTMNSSVCVRLNVGMAVLLRDYHGNQPVCSFGGKTTRKSWRIYVAQLEFLPGLIHENTPRP